MCVCVWERERERERELSREAEREGESEQALEPHFLDADHFTRLLHLPNSHPEAIDFADHFHWYPTKTNYKPIKPFMALKHVYVCYLVWSLQPPFHKCRRTLINLSTPWERNFSLSASKKSSYHGKHYFGTESVEMSKMLFNWKYISCREAYLNYSSLYCFWLL